MMDVMMIITTVSVMYLAAWALYSRDKMSGIMPSILAAMAVAVIVAEVAAYSVVLLPRMPLAVSAAVFTATATLFATCSLARTNERSGKIKRDKSR